MQNKWDKGLYFLDFVPNFGEIIPFLSVYFFLCYTTTYGYGVPKEGYDMSDNTYLDVLLALLEEDLDARVLPALPTVPP